MEYELKNIWYLSFLNLFFQEEEEEDLLGKKILFAPCESILELLRDKIERKRYKEIEYVCVWERETDREIKREVEIYTC